MSNPKVQAQVFDLGGVIVAHDNPVMARRLAGKCREAWGPAEVGRLASQRRWGAGAPMSELHELLRSEAGYGDDWDQFCDDWCYHLSVDFAMLDYVERLAARHRVMIFSNTNSVHWCFLVTQTNGRLESFEAYLSHELGVQKPELEAYALVAAKAGLCPETLLFFDDLAVNVEGARRAGFQADVFTGQEALRADLARRQIESF